MGEYDIKIENGFLVTVDGLSKSDILIGNGKIKKVGKFPKARASKTVDATGNYVLPGLIDPHTHPVYLDDLGDLSKSAAYGGTTTLIHYAYAKPGKGLMETIDSFRSEGESKSVLDFGLHGGLFDPENQSGEIPSAVQEGVRSFKMFMTYAKLGWMTDDYQLMRTLDIISESGGLGMVHAENGLATDYLQDKYNEKGLDPVETFLATRPARLEAEAINRAASMAQVAECPLYIPHMTAEEDIEVIRRFKDTGFPIFGETCPQYLSLTSEQIFEKGPLAKIGPPIREAEDQDALWKGLADGTIDTVASDHAPKPKTKEDDFFDAPYGSPQVETLSSVIYQDGVNGGRISLTQFVEKASTNPAKIFGLYPDKGSLEEGTDADLVIFDPTITHTIKQESQHSNATYTLYQGKKCLGKPVFSTLRGEVLLENESLQAGPGRGKFLSTEINY